MAAQNPNGDGGPFEYLRGMDPVVDQYASGAVDGGNDEEEMRRGVKRVGASEYGMPMSTLDPKTQLASVTPQHTSLLNYLVTAMRLPMDAAALLTTKLLPMQPVRTPQPNMRSGDPRNTDQYVPPTNGDRLRQHDPPWMQAGFENVHQYDAWLRRKPEGTVVPPTPTRERPSGVSDAQWGAAQQKSQRGKPAPSRFSLSTQGQASAPNEEY